MPIRRMTCPNCGASVYLKEGQKLLKCNSCSSLLEYDDGIVRIQIRDEAEILKQTVEKEKIAAGERENKNQNRSLIILFVIIILLPAIPFLISYTYIHPENQNKFVGRDYESVVKELRGARFWFVNAKAVEDLEASEYISDGIVSYVTINDNKTYPKEVRIWDHVEVVYHKLPKNPPVKAPADSGSAYRGWKLQDAVNKMYAIGFATVNTRAEHDLDSVTHGDIGKVNTITINGETDWAIGNTRKTYHRDDTVIVFYHDARDDAQASPPVGNASELIGQDYRSVRGKFEEAGFINIELIEKKELTTNDILSGLVTNVTVNGETNWTYGIFGSLRKTYARNTQVIITYNSVK